MIMTTVLPVLHVLPWPSPWTGDWLAYLSTIVSTFAQPSNHSRDDDVPLLLLWLLRRTRSFYDTLHLILLGLSCVFCRRRLPISQKRIQLFAMAKEDEEEEDDNNNIMNSTRGASYQEKDQLSGICISVPLSCWMYICRHGLLYSGLSWMDEKRTVNGCLSVLLSVALVAQARMYGWSM